MAGKPEQRSSAARAVETSAALATLEAQRRLYERWFRPGGLEAFVWEAPCRTVDEHDRETPAKPLPDLAFLHLFFQLCQSERWLNVVKSRQVFMTWSVFCYLLWRVLAAPNQSIAFVPKKESDGQRHIEERIKGALWHNLPEWLKDQYALSPIKGAFLISARQDPWANSQQRWNSGIVVYPQGAEQLRSFTHTVVVGDEVAHQRGHQEWWKAAIPTIQKRGNKGGQIIQLSSAKRGSFYQQQLGQTLLEAVQAAREVVPDAA